MSIWLPVYFFNEPASGAAGISASVVKIEAGRPSLLYKLAALAFIAQA